jgi:hypothetical protein
MDVRNSLMALKEDIMTKIQLAASQHQTQWIMQLGTLAKQVEADLVTLAEIEERLESFMDQLHGLNPSESPEVMLNGQLTTQGLPRSTAVEGTSPSIRKQGMDAATIARQAFVQTCHNRGIRVLVKKRTLVSTPNGALIVLPFAREFPDKPDRWFLGAKEGGVPSICPYLCVAFLCQDADERLLTFIVPQQPLQQHWHQFSRHGAAVKFNIQKDGVNFLLSVPGNPPLRLRGYPKISLGTTVHLLDS